MLRAHGDILQLRRIGERQMGVSQWLFLFPGDQVEPVAPAEPRQAEHGSDALDVVQGERPNLHRRNGS